MRYEIFRSVFRGNKTFGVHINQIKGKDQQVKANGPNPFEYLALRYSLDGTSVEPLEYEGGEWVASPTMEKYTLKTTASADKRGKAIQLSKLGYRTYCWSADKGYDSFNNWVG